MQYLPFIVGCVVALTQKVEEDFSQRRVRIIKYRGSSYSENATALIIGSGGIEVAAADEPVLDLPLTEKVSTGIQQLDEMLYGGIWRGSITMITGGAGTAKTTLSGTFAEAAAQRGERTLYVAFDEIGQELVRNLASVNIHLGEHVKNGTLQVLFGLHGIWICGTAPSPHQEPGSTPTIHLAHHRSVHGLLKREKLGEHSGDRGAFGPVGKRRRHYLRLHQSAHP